MLDFKKDRLELNLPDCFDKSEDSNNHKLLETERQSIDKHSDDLWDIFQILDLDNARNKTLDHYGARVGQARGLADDEKYLILIKSKIMRNLNNGTYPSILNSICATFDCKPEEVYIGETNNPCNVSMVALPLDIINRVGMSATQIIALVKSLLPICITLDNVSLEGTFEFASGEGETDNNKGFSDVEGGTIGGYLGYMSGDEDEPILPI